MLEKPGVKPSPPLFDTILYDEPRPRIARITLNRAERKNAQNLSMIYQIDAALRHAATDPDISVIVLAAAGQDFSAGHDLSFGEESYRPDDYAPLGLWSEFGARSWCSPPTGGSTSPTC
jgi:enoyl-CoA hydratase